MHPINDANRPRIPAREADFFIRALIYPNWYLNVASADMIAQLYRGVQGAGGAGKPFIVSEIGAGALYGDHDPRRAKWSEERQSDILSEQLAALLGSPDIAGFFLWQFSDTRVTQEGGWFRDRPRTMNNKGLTDEFRRPKLAYETVKRLLRGAKAQRFSPSATPS